MTREQAQPLISAVSHWERPDDAAIDAFLAILRPRRLAIGDHWIRAGEPSESVAFLHRGLLRYYATAESGKEMTRYFCQGPSFVSSQTALLTGKPSLFSIQALTETELFVFRWNEWRALTQRHAVLARIEIRLLEQAAVLSEAREWSLVLEDAATRYERFLAEFPGVEPLVRQSDIATYLGVTPETLSRIRRNRSSN